MGLFVYTQKGSIISMVDLPTTEIIEPIDKKASVRELFLREKILKISLKNSLKPIDKIIYIEIYIYNDCGKF